jgi:hypothetical protein
MKKYFFTLGIALLALQVSAQKTEISINANPGLFYFGGTFAASTSQIVATNGDDGYVNNPFSTKPTFSYGIALQVQHILKSGFIMGFQGGYDILRSRTNANGGEPVVYYGYIDYAFTTSTGIPYIEAASGSATMQNQTITLNPYVGWRFKAKTLNIDVLPGADIAFTTSSYEKGSTTTTYNTTFTTNFKNPNPPADIRIKLAVAGYYKRFGLNLSYAYGLTNYLNVSKNDPNGAYSRLLRMGLSYRLF